MSEVAPLPRVVHSISRAAFAAVLMMLALAGAGMHAARVRGDESAAGGGLGGPAGGARAAVDRDRITARALARLRDPGDRDVEGIVDRLAEALRGDGRRWSDVAGRLLALLGHGDRAVVIRAIDATGDLVRRSVGSELLVTRVDQTVLARLQEVASDRGRDALVRLAALAAQSVRGREGTLSDEASAGTAVALLVKGDEAVAAAAVGFLETLPRDAVAVPLAAHLGRPEAVARRRALEAAAILGVPLPLEPVGALLREDESASVRAAAARLVGRLTSRDPEAAGRLLREALRDGEPSPRVREALCGELGRPGLVGRENSRVLCSMLDDPIVEVRWVALEALATAGDRYAFLQVSRHLLDEPEGSRGARLAREAQKRIMSRIRRPTQPEEYRPEARLEEKRAIIEAVRAAPAGVVQEKGIDALISMLADPDPGARAEAAEALRELTPAGRDAAPADPFGYRFDDPADTRRDAARGWREWYWRWTRGER